MNLDPASYACTTHGNDLTPLVTEAVDELVPPVAFARRRGPRGFTVIVSCPGTGTQDPAHDLAFDGQYTP